jgi:Flp pilus assembly protein TadD
MNRRLLATHLTSLALAALIAAAASLAHAADTPGAAPVTSPYPGGSAGDALAPARALIAEKKWEAAIDALKKVSNPASADWNNLMGYTHRKAPAPDIAAAERYYGEALRIDPKHRGALEYSGELYLVKGDLATAEQRLAALDKACFMPCDEHKSLKEAVARYKANGNRYVAK